MKHLKLHFLSFLLVFSLASSSITANPFTDWISKNAIPNTIAAAALYILGAGIAMDANKTSSNPILRYPAFCSSLLLLGLSANRLLAIAGLNPFDFNWNASFLKKIE